MILEDWVRRFWELLKYFYFHWELTTAIYTMDPIEKITVSILSLHLGILFSFVYTRDNIHLFVLVLRRCTVWTGLNKRYVCLNIRFFSQQFYMLRWVGYKQSRMNHIKVALLHYVHITYCKR